MFWSQVIFFANDNMVTMVKRVEEAFDRLQPLFSRKVKFLDLMILKGEGSQSTVSPRLMQTESM